MLPPPGPPLRPDPGVYHRGAADLAKSMADEFSTAAKVLRDAATPEAEKNALASRLWEAHWAMLGHRANDVPAIVIAFVASTEAAIKHVEDCRTMMADPSWTDPPWLAKYSEEEQASMRELLEGQRAWAESASVAEHARWLFSHRYPRHAARLSVEDMGLAVAAVRGESGDKHATLATIIGERLRLKITRDSLATYLKKHRRAARPPWGGH